MQSRVTWATFTCHLFWLIQKDPKMFPGQPRDIVPPALRSSSRWDIPRTPLQGAIPKQMLEPPQLANLDVEEQRLQALLR